MFAVGGEKEIKVWDIRESAAGKTCIKGRINSDILMVQRKYV